MFDSMPEGNGMRRLVVALALTTLAIVVASKSATAALRLCNYTESRVGVAIGYKDKKGWVSEGWWTVEPTTNPDPKKCQELIKGPLNARFYYVYAIDFQKGGSWGGSSNFCVRDKLFTIRGIGNCKDRTYKKAGFFEVDTGDEKDWTISLSGEKTSPPPPAQVTPQEPLQPVEPPAQQQ
jgi:uncharacterized membrane protein